MPVKEEPQLNAVVWAIYHAFQQSLARREEEILPKILQAVMDNNKVPVDLFTFPSKQEPIARIVKQVQDNQLWFFQSVIATTSINILGPILCKDVSQAFERAFSNFYQEIIDGVRLQRVELPGSVQIIPYKGKEPAVWVPSGTSGSKLLKTWLVIENGIGFTGEESTSG